MQADDDGPAAGRLVPGGVFDHTPQIIIPRPHDDPDMRPLPNRPGGILPTGMISAGFLNPASATDLIEPVRDGSVAHRLSRRADARVLPDQGMRCGQIATALLLWIKQAFGIVHESRSGLIAMLHLPGMDHRKPKAIARTPDPAKQGAFIKLSEILLKDTSVGMTRICGRQRLNMHRAVDLQTETTAPIEVDTINPASTIKPTMDRCKRVIDPWLVHRHATHTRCSKAAAA